MNNLCFVVNGYYLVHCSLYIIPSSYSCFLRLFTIYFVHSYCFWVFFFWWVWNVMINLVFVCDKSQSVQNISYIMSMCVCVYVCVLQLQLQIACQNAHFSLYFELFFCDIIALYLIVLVNMSFFCIFNVVKVLWGNKRKKPKNDGIQAIA